jgi:hypothetical protein
MDVTAMIAIVFFFSTLVIIWGGYLLTRHKERAMMIDKGLKAEEIKSLYSRGTWQTNPLSSLKWGIIILAIGLAALFGMYLHANLLVEEGVIPGLMAAFGGAGLILFYFIARKKVSVEK